MLLDVHTPIFAWEGSVAAWLRCVDRPTVRFACVVLICIAGDGEFPLLLLFVMIVNPSGDGCEGGLLFPALIQSDSILRRTLHSCVAFRYAWNTWHVYFCHALCFPPQLAHSTLDSLHCLVS